MAHLYDKAPPAFAKDPWAWDYTRDRMEGNTGLPYDQWQGKHFAGAAAMYKNVVKKYGASVENGVTTMPKECIDCGNVNVHYQDDYVCKTCRDAIESAGSYEEASKTISNPGSMDAIRDALYESLGHAAKDAKKGKDPFGKQSNPGATIAEAVSMDEPQVTQWDRSEPQGVSRNYKAMGDSKLKKCISELENGSGDAVKRAQAKDEDVDDHLEAALRAAQENGLVL